MRRTAAAVDRAGACASSQSGLPPPVRDPAMSYMSLTPAVRPASGPWAAPAMGAAKSCGTKAERDRAADIQAPEFLSLLVLSEIPIEDLGAVPSDHAIPSQNLFEGALHMPDAVRHAGKIGVAGDRHDLRALGRLLVQTIEVVERAPIHHLGGVMLKRHHDDVVELEIVGERDNRTVRRLERDRFVVEHPITDIFDPGLGEVVESVVGLGEPRTEPAARSLAPEFFDDVHRFHDDAALVVELVHRHLVIAVGVELPAVLDAG